MEFTSSLPGGATIFIGVAIAAVVLWFAYALIFGRNKPKG